MKKIPLTQQKFALVDDEDFDLLSQWKWHAHKKGKIQKCFYARRQCYKGGKQKTIAMHRIVLKAKDDECCDHINGSGLDNRKENLRICTPQENSRNVGPVTRKYSKFKGVTFEHNKWRVRIRGNDRRKLTIGSFNNEIDAAIAYNMAAIKYHGEFARLNDIDTKEC